MSRTILKILQKAAIKTSFASLTAVVGSKNSTAKRFLVEAEEAGLEIINNIAWAVLESRGIITLQNGVSDYALPTDFNYALADTFWEETDKRMLYGPISSKYQQVLDHSISNLTTHTNFKIDGWSDKQFHVSPTPTSDQDGMKVYFRYLSKSWIRPQSWEEKSYSKGDKVWNDGNRYRHTGLYDPAVVSMSAPTHTTGIGSDGYNRWLYIEEIQEEFEADTDVPIIDDRLLQLAVQYKVLDSCGFDSTKAEARFEKYKQDIASNLKGAHSFNPTHYSRSLKYHPNAVEVTV